MMTYTCTEEQQRMMMTTYTDSCEGWRAGGVHKVTPSGRIIRSRWWIRLRSR